MFGFVFVSADAIGKNIEELTWPSVAWFSPDGLIWSQEIMEIFVHNPNNHWY